MLVPPRWSSILIASAAYVLGDTVTTTTTTANTNNDDAPTAATTSTPTTSPVEIVPPPAPLIFYLITIVLTVLVLRWYGRYEHKRQQMNEPQQSIRVAEYSAAHPPDPTRIFYPTELIKYNGSDKTGPIYLGCAGLVYDMTSGDEFYGPQGPYAQLAGRDASRALAMMELHERGLRVDDLDAIQRKTLQEWVEKFQEKYPIVGVLCADFTKLAIAIQEAEDRANGGPPKPKAGPRSSLKNAEGGGIGNNSGGSGGGSKKKT